MRSAEIKQFVRRQYAQIAYQGSLCCPGCACERNPYQQARVIGYQEEELGSLPYSAVMGLGCGNPVALAELKSGETVLDLGSGGGMDCFLASQKVGPQGFVIGVDMTREMIDRARGAARNHSYENVEFRMGDLETLPVDDESVDVVISNCSINLCPDKRGAYAEAFRVLRAGGRMAVSDLVIEGELPEQVRGSLKAWAQCIAGALPREEYLETIGQAGFQNLRVLSEHHFEHLDEEVGGRIISLIIGAGKSKTHL